MAAKMAVEDFGGKVLGRPIELLIADHQNKPDIAAAKAREWFDTQKSRGAARCRGFRNSLGGPRNCERSQ